MTQDGDLPGILFPGERLNRADTSLSTIRKSPRLTKNSRKLLIKGKSDESLFARDRVSGFATNRAHEIGWISVGMTLFYRCQPFGRIALPGSPRTEGLTIVSHFSRMEGILRGDCGLGGLSESVSAARSVLQRLKRRWFCEAYVVANESWVSNAIQENGAPG